MHVCTCSLSRNTPPWPHQTAKCIFFQSSREPSKIYEKRNMFRLACLCFDSLCSFFCSFHVFFFCGFFLVFLFAFVLISCSVFPFSALNFGCVFLLFSSIYLRFLPIFCLFFAHFFSVYLFAFQHVSPHYLLPLSLGIPGCISAQNIFRCLMLTIGPLRTFLFRMSCSGFISRQEFLHVFSYSCTSAKYHMINEEKCICFDYQPRRAVKCAMTY